MARLPRLLQSTQLLALQRNKLGKLARMELRRRLQQVEKYTQRDYLAWPAGFKKFHCQQFQPIAEQLNCSGSGTSGMQASLTLLGSDKTMDLKKWAKKMA